MSDVWLRHDVDILTRHDLDILIRHDVMFDVSFFTSVSLMCGLMLGMNFSKNVFVKCMSDAWYEFL